jgi:hypothetical protein
MVDGDDTAFVGCFTVAYSLTRLAPGDVRFVQTGIYAAFLVSTPIRCTSFEKQNLERENRRLTSIVRRQQIFIATLETEHPGIGEVVRDEEGAIVLSPSELSQLALAS